jgi:hypothetical protein
MRAAAGAVILVFVVSATSAQTPGVTFGAPTSIDLGTREPAGHVVADFNQDGHLDLLVTSKGAPGLNVNLLTGDGSGLLSHACWNAFADASAVAAADFNGDGALDVTITQDLVTNGAYGDPVCGSLVGVAIFLGPNMSLGRCLTTVPRPFAVQAGDFDGDCRPDIAVISATGRGHRGDEPDSRWARLQSSARRQTRTAISAWLHSR